MKKYAAEFVGTFWLVLGGCGSAVLAAAFPDLGIGLLGVALAFGLTVLTMAFAIGHISGCHLNPAVSIGLYVGRRFEAKELVPYIIAQVLAEAHPGNLGEVVVASTSTLCGGLLLSTLVKSDEFLYLVPVAQIIASILVEKDTAARRYRYRFY